ncbi:MAG: GAF domain-containing protein [Thiobacillaceae bacterium]|nr:GAF domain-containing protein [Thiobacillaceae bacterium]MDW8322554.1 GAF domain-containing protein [Burkholderiales bacterium]
MQEALTRLHALIDYAPQGPFEADLAQLAERTAALLEAERVSFMLRDIGPGGAAALRVAAVGGSSSIDRRHTAVAQVEGIANEVLASGRCILVQDIRSSPYRALARREELGVSFMACPLTIAGAPAGVMNVSAPRGRPCFTPDDLVWAETAALVVARHIERLRLTQVLDARFVQLALAQEVGGNCAALTRLTAHEPERVAKLLAKTFYRELHRCGFSPNQIIHAAGEIISELTASLNRHRQRLARKS